MYIFVTNLLPVNGSNQKKFGSTDKQMPLSMQSQQSPQLAHSVKPFCLTMAALNTDSVALLRYLLRGINIGPSVFSAVEDR